ncbi:hypothetical protein [Streptomyces vastus]|uniref:Uncharacterized protein n=1 Tax=Streptomyces vastus TaxID=285451 RepID=A0ABN3QXE4_9ACTN
MRILGSLTVAGASLALVLGGGAVAQAQTAVAQSDVTIRSATPSKPYKSGGSIVAKATFSGNRSTCVYLEAVNPLYPPVPVASKCSNAASGTITASKSCSTGFFNTKVIYTQTDGRRLMKDSGSVYIQC